jgi:hypothetical protein
MRLLLYASLAGALLVPSTGCLTVRANVPDALNMPEPPARVVTPPMTPAELPPAVTPPQQTPPPTTAPDNKPPTNPTGGSAPARPPQNTTPPTTVAPPPENPPVLQTRPDTEVLQTRIIQQLGDAKRDLDRIDWRHLSPNARAQYDVARQLYRYAEELFKAKNFNLADGQSYKAAVMAAQLAKGRPAPSPTSP